MPRKTNRYRYGKHLYCSWVQMRSRCRNPKHDAYPRYGGRGITVCDEWEDYEAFAQWALSNGFEDGLTIERIDVNGNYCPDNCTWISRGDQARNRRNNVKIEYNGQIKTGAEWAREIGRGKQCVLRRLRKGMSIEEALNPQKFKPNRTYKKVEQYQNDTLIGAFESAEQAAKSNGEMNPRTIRWACRTGNSAYGFTWKYEAEEAET